MQADSARQLRSLLEEASSASSSNSNQAGLFSDAVGTAESVGQAIKNNVPMPEDAADILQTVGKLKALSPLYTYAIYHPIRFLLSYLILPLPSLLLFLILAILQIIAYVLKSLIYPFYLAFHFITAPARIAFSFLHALMPVWIFLGSAIFIGCCVGALAGLLMGGTTKYAIAKSLDVAVWPLRVIGLVEPSKLQRRENRTFGADGGATLESIPRSSASRRRSGEGKGKTKLEEELMTTTDEEGERGFGRNNSTSFESQQRTNRLRTMGSSSSSEEDEDKVFGSSNGVRGRKNVRSSWRKRHVEGVLR
ncbi:uncharacterized protein JCM6883_003498 [Sporobolomyces salmoneus]|uniref:uncharacterized protein n=1 Tax=Sporobolomyces salmoneus TaxID=183962 RepID=UPI003171A92B